MKHTPQTDLAASIPPAPRRRDLERQSHSAHFYSNDDLLVAEIAQRLAATLTLGGSALAIATPAHLQALESQLTVRGFDIPRLTSQGRWLALDAAGTLAAFMMEGWPDAQRFTATVSELVNRLEQAATLTLPEEFPVAAFGEMVAVLWEEGKTGAAIRLEELWNELARTHRFHLSCGWPLRFFSRDMDGVVIQRICSEHTHIVPGQGYESMSDDERRRSAVLWQLKAQALEEEVRQSRKTQQTLYAREAELRDFLENAVIGMHWLAPDGTVLWANRTELSLLGYEHDEYVGHPFADFVADAGPADEILRSLIGGATVRGCELRICCGDGSIRWIRLDANPWFHNGHFLHTRCFVLDITGMKRADAAQMKLAAIVESSDDAIVSKDLNGIVTSWNAAAERILGWKAGEIIGKPITTVIPPHLHGDEVEILRKIQAGERIEHYETVRQTKGGELLDVSLTISPVRDLSGTIVGAAKILRDVTQQKRLEAALRTTERLASVGRLAATVAHEINNPLEAVANLIYLACLNPELPASARGCLVTADEELQRVSHIARQTLGFYRDTSSPVRIRVSDAIEEVLAIYERRYRYKDMTVLRRVSPALTVRSLMGEFKQILSNLFANAIDASLQGGTIRISAWEACHPFSKVPGIRLAVADEGVGVPAANLRRIFTPFFTTKKDVGTGLGLWIAKDLLEKKGGSIRCRSRVSGLSRRRSGTVMMVFLPTVADPAACQKAA